MAKLKTVRWGFGNFWNSGREGMFYKERLYTEKWGQTVEWQEKDGTFIFSWRHVASRSGGVLMVLEMFLYDPNELSSLVINWYSLRQRD